MKKSEINFNISLDDNNVPEKITWDATDKPSDSPSVTDAILLSLWDPEQKNTLRIDLWSKDMSVDEMKRLCVDSLGGMAQTIRSATGDDFMADEMEALCQKLVDHIVKKQQK
ncbi:MAG: gliding motility protein GldC [Cytophagales bacterium]|nr:gliding motility protein GldC [Cytophagales bacterium]